MGQGTLRDPFLDIEKNVTTINEQVKGRDESDINGNICRRNRIAIALCLSLLLVGISAGFIFGSIGQETEIKNNDKEDVVTSENGVVAADHETCSEIGANVLELPSGTAVDAAVAVAFCLGVVNPTSSGIGGGAFMVVAKGSSLGSVATTYDMRETAPSGASQDMFKGIEAEKARGPLLIAVPGEVAGLYKAWETHGRVPWKLLVEPSIKLAREGFKVGVHLAYALFENEDKIKNDTGLKSVFTNGYDKLLKEGDTCYNLKLAETLEAVATNKTKGFYEGDVAKNLADDVKKAGGIMELKDIQSYEVNVSDAMVVDDVMGYKIQGMWPPSSGTPGFAMVMNVLAEYKNVYGEGENLGQHRVIEAMKHMLAARMDLGDPAFVNGTYDVVKKMISKSYAKKIREKIFDDQTFSPEYYLSKFSQLKDQGTSHFCVVDKDRNVVSMTTTVNYAFGSGFMSPSTGIILNNQMADFSIPTEVSPDRLPPAPANYIASKKRPLSSMTPIIITKENELVGVIGASGGLFIIPAVIQVFLNHFILKMSPLEAVESARVYHSLVPNKVLYEDRTVYSGKRIKLNEDTQMFLNGTIKHELVSTERGAVVQFVVQNRVDESKTVLTAVSDLRKGGKPAAANAAPTPTPAPSPFL